MLLLFFLLSIVLSLLAGCSLRHLSYLTIVFEDSLELDFVSAKSIFRFLLLLTAAGLLLYYLR